LEPEKWVNVFTRLLVEQGHSVKLFDVATSKARAVAERYGGEHSDNFSEAASGADLILICATTKTVPDIIADVEAHIGPDTIVCEIASHKTNTIPALRRFGGLRPLSIHPMFGPDIDKFDGETIAVVTVNDSDEETERARTFLPGTKLVPLDPEAHDRCMASILSLPYFMNIVFARVLSEGDLPLMKELAGPSFEVQISVTESIVGESPDLIRSLISDNPFSSLLIQKFMDEIKNLATHFEAGPESVDPLLEELRGSMGGEVELESAREFRNLMLESLKKR
jgi:prephenate dehydrogenase